jgi:hypothetical protein
VTQLVPQHAFKRFGERWATPDGLRYAVVEVRPGDVPASGINPSGVRWFTYQAVEEAAEQP